MPATNQIAVSNRPQSDPPCPLPPTTTKINFTISNQYMALGTSPLLDLAVIKSLDGALFVHAMVTRESHNYLRVDGAMTNTAIVLDGAVREPLQVWGNVTIFMIRHDAPLANITAMLKAECARHGAASTQPHPCLSVAVYIWRRPGSPVTIHSNKYDTTRPHRSPSIHPVADDELEYFRSSASSASGATV